MSRPNKAKNIKWHETCNCECRLDAMFITINNVGMKINVDANVKN